MSDSPRTLPPEALEAWAAALQAELVLPDPLPIARILDLAREVAADVARPAAPLSAFAAGLAAGRAGGSTEQVGAALDAVVRRAHGWER